MTDIDYSRLRELAEKAEHRAWHITTQGGIEPTPYTGPGEEFASVASVRHQGDWEFIAAVDPQTVLALLDERAGIDWATERADRAPSDAEAVAFREAWHQADAEGDRGNRVRRGLLAAQEVRRG